MSAYAQFGYSYPSASQLLVAGQPTTATSPPLGAGASSGGGVTAGAVSPGSGGGATGNGAPPPAGATSCCENGRPMVTDPVSGQTVCSCQYDSARLALSSYPRLSTSGVGVYGTPYPSTDQNPYPSIGVDSSAFYSPLSNPYALKDGSSSADMSAWTSAGLQPTTGYYPYDPTLAAYGYGAGYDLAARRKNATRESTATLKAWLNEHKKNPYPTKGEKIMLAIITKMTLTQVSTWFANARRRLKKENKMTWEPRNRVEDEDNNNEDDGSASGRKSADNVKDPDSKDSGTGSSEDGDRTAHHRLELLERGPCGGGGPGAGGGGLDTGSEWSESRPDSPECLFERPPHILHPAYHSRLLGPNPSSAPSPPPPSGASASNPSKPRIWSLADMASKDSDVHHLATPVSTSAFYSAAVAAGKLISPLANRGPLHPHHLHPSVHHPAGSYARPTHHDFYRSFYGPATHLAGAGGGNAGDVSLLETYSRTFGAGLGTGGSPAGAPGTGITPLSSVLSKAAVAAAAAAAAGSGAGTPFALNGGAGTLGLAPASSGASSSSSAGSGTASEQHAPPQDVRKLQQAPLNKA